MGRVDKFEGDSDGLQSCNFYFHWWACFFLYGIKSMSEGLQAVAGDKWGVS